MRIYQRGAAGIWWADFYIDGQPRVRKTSGTTNEAAAREWAAKVEADLWRVRRLGEKPTITWEHAAREWIEEHAHLRTLDEIKRNLTWLHERLKGKALTAIDTALVKKLRDERRAESVHGREGGPRVSKATVNLLLSDLSRVLNYAHEREWIAGVPAMGKLSNPQGRIVWITQDQAADLLAELPEHLRLMTRFALATGLRESNIRLLEWKQVDIRRALAWVYADKAKAGKDISVPLNDDAVDVLRTQQGRHRKWVFPVPRWTRDAEGVGVQVYDSPTGKVCNHAWRKACVRAGLPTLRFHDMRHTWASWHVQRGTPLPVLQQLGGWASLAMVQRYAHLGQSHIAAWANNSGMAACGTGRGTKTPQGTSKGTLHIVNE